MKKVFDLTRLLIFLFSISFNPFDSSCLLGQDKGPLQQSFRTLGFTLPSDMNSLTEEEMEDLRSRFASRVRYWNEQAKRNNDAGGFSNFLKNIPEKAFDASGFLLENANWAHEYLPETAQRYLPNRYILKGISGIHNQLDKRFFEEKSKEHQINRDFKVREVFENTATAIVEDYCSGDVDCAEGVFQALLNDPEVQKEIMEADALGGFDEAHTRAYTKASLEKSLENYQGTTIEIENLESTISSAVTDIKTTVVDNFQEMNFNQKRIIDNTSKIMHVQQEHAIALENLRFMVSENLTLIDKKVDNITALQQENLFISKAILEGVVEIDTRITKLSVSFAKMEKRQQAEKIQEIFQNSPINIQINELENKNSAISKNLSEEKRLELLENLKAIKKKQDIVNVANAVGEWGTVGKEALTVFCQGRDCPSEISRGIEVGLALTDIVGNITTGNWAQASMSALGIFKKPEPGPELKMLNQISDQLNSLEANMSQGFQNVHEHLFAIEENLGNRLNIIDAKMDQLTHEVIQTRLEILKSLNRVDKKLDYIANQNECIKDLILQVTLAQNQDLCKAPSNEFNKRLEEGKIDDFQDLNNFFVGGSCRSCVDALFKVPDHKNSPSFRYTQCPSGEQHNKSAPDKIYTFIYTKLLKEERHNEGLIQSLLLIPKDVRDIDSLQNLLSTREDGPSIILGEQDRHYRNYRAVLDYAYYLLSMFPFMELYDLNGNLLSPEEIRLNPGFSRERTQFMIHQLEGTVDLINHTIFQQSLMAGNGVFHQLDNIIEGRATELEEDDITTLQEIFSYNPYLRKNYASYFLERVAGIEKVKSLMNNEVLKKGTQRIVMEGFNILFYTDGKGPVFLVSLTNKAEPENHIPLFSSYLPVANDAIDKNSYSRNFEFAYPPAINELLEMKNLVLNKLGEMKLIASPDLDEPSSELSRQELNQLISEYQN